jgi:hypothetical protein
VSYVSEKYVESRENEAKTECEDENVNHRNEEQ